MNQRLIEDGVRRILRGLELDLTDQNFKQTPGRVARLYMEMLTPKKSEWTTFATSYDAMVVLRNHKVFALCPHHLLPVELKCYVGYIPGKKVLGLSKLARVIESLLTTPIMQEELTANVAAQLNNLTDPKGVACVMSGVHGCMKYRGVLTDGDVVTSAMKGVFLHNQAAREEFLNLIGRP